MSIYKPQNSPHYHFDFRLKGHRFHGSTGQTTRREAERIERAERERARDLVRAQNVAAADITIDIAAGRYWQEVGQHHADSAGTWRDLQRLVEYFGRHKRLVDITDGDIAELVAWRRGHRRWKRNDEELISPSTVNRSTTQVLQKVFMRARKCWKARFDNEPDWRSHRLREPEEHVRELHEDEAGRIDEAMRADYAPFFAFAMATGLRFSECLLHWREVNWDTGVIIKRGKGGRRVTVPITPEVRAILWPLRGDHPDAVFTYVAMRTCGGRIRGQRYPVTRSGAKTEWKRLRAKATVENFRFHDFRHDVGTKLLRDTGNLKLVQKALNHANIKTTTRYAHVLGDEVADALARVQKSRTESRTETRRVG